MPGSDRCIVGAPAVPHLPSMIAEFLSAQFPDHIRARGDAIFADGAVELDEPPLPTGWLLRGVAFGNDAYTVGVRARKDGLHLWCQCPYFQQGKGNCKHLWALLAAAEVEDVLPVEFAEPGTTDRQPQAWAKSAGRIPKAPRNPPWHEHLVGAGREALALGFVMQPSQSWPADQRLIYVLDLDASLAGSHFELAVMLQRPDKHGGWGKPKSFRHDQAAFLSAPDPLDRRMAELLVSGVDIMRYTDVHPFASSVGVNRDLVPALLSALAATGRLWLRPQRGGELRGPMEVIGGAWDATLVVSGEGAPEGQLRVTLEVESGPDRWPGDHPVLLPYMGVVLDQLRVAALARSSGLAIAATVQSRLPLMVPAGDLDQLLLTMAALPATVPLRCDPALAVQLSRGTPAPVAEFQRSTVHAWERPHTAGPRFRVAVAFEYGNVRTDAGDLRHAFYEPGARAWCARDEAAEAAFARTLTSLCPVTAYDSTVRHEVHVVYATDAPRVWRELANRGWRVLVDGSARRSSSGIRVAVRSGIDWFSLEGAVRFDDLSVSLDEALAALRAGSPDIVLADGSVGTLGVSEARMLALLADAAQLTAGSGRFAKSQTALLDALLSTLPEVETDERFERARNELASFDKVRPGKAPRGFHGTLRPYQRQALGWFGFLRQFGLGGCLADDMGLGKTVQVLALLEARRAEGAGCSIVVVPRSLVFNWRREAERFSPQLRVTDWSGMERRGRTLDTASTDVVITTYGTLRRDALALSDVTFDYAILDEAQAIKNAGTASAKAARLLKAQHRLALTGTPVENRIEELWSLLEFLNPGMLGASTTFRSLANMAGGDQPDALRPLARALRPVILRRTKEQVAPELPERSEQTVRVTLEEKQRSTYDAVLRASRAEVFEQIDRLGMARTRLHVLEALLRLRQAACHTALLPSVGRGKRKAPAGGGESAKFDALLPMLAECVAEGHKALVFSQFTSLLALLRARLDADGVTYEYLDGATRNREAAVERFQSAAGASLFLISLKAGGHGLNLTAADYVFLLDPWWNPAVEAQAIDRAHRIGQTRHVMATRLVAADTVEEKILILQASKRALADAIVGGDERGALAGITREELELLLS